jgi:WhiB family redox-sensing transcriptional regulator
MGHPRIGGPRPAEHVEDWTDLARCRGMESEAFFGRNLTEARAAIRTCDRCEVRQQCLDYAVAENIEIGVWGGLTERQRRAYIRQQSQRKLAS